MKLGRVAGSVVATVKNGPLEGKKLLLVRPIDRSGKASGPLIVALDSIGSGAQEEIYYVRGKEASFSWHPQDVPSDCTIVGILDPMNFETANLPPDRRPAPDSPASSSQSLPSDSQPGS